MPCNCLHSRGGPDDGCWPVFGHHSDAMTAATAAVFANERDQEAATHSPVAATTSSGSISRESSRHNSHLEISRRPDFLLGPWSITLDQLTAAFYPGRKKTCIIHSLFSHSWVFKCIPGQPSVSPGNDVGLNACFPSDTVRMFASGLTGQAGRCHTC